MMLARYKKIANFTFLARWANLAIVVQGVRFIKSEHADGDGNQR